jgi:hypothetical protein
MNTTNCKGMLLHFSSTSLSQAFAPYPHPCGLQLTFRILEGKVRESGFCASENVVSRRILETGIPDSRFPIPVSLPLFGLRIEKVRCRLAIFIL